MEETKVAVVAGGTAGVGRAVTEALLARGWTVGVLARGAERLEALKAEYGERVSPQVCDVADAAAVEAAGDAIAAELGRPTAWVNCAMLTSFSPFAKMSAEEFDTIVGGTFTGQVNGTRTALRLLKAHEGGTGRIVNVGSGLSYRAVPFQSAYCAAKHAINGFTSAVRSELIREKSRVTLSLVQLPAINTPQFDWARNRLERKPQPAPPIYQPEVAAKAVLRALDGGARELFVGQSVLKLVFGDMVLPGWLDAKMADDGAEMQKSDRPDGDGPDNLDGPAAREGTARGSYSGRASDSGLIVDADTARKAVFGGALAVTFVLGLLLG